MSEPLRADIASARDRMHLGWGAGRKREIQRLAKYLAPSERVTMMAAGAYGGPGILVLTDRRVLFLVDRIGMKVSEDFSLDRITNVQWALDGMGPGTLTIHAAGATAEIKHVDRRDGPAIVEAIRLATAPSPAVGATSSVSTVAEQLTQLAALRDQGVLTDDEFATQKARLLG